ncbi:MAG: SDR family oxidoreductase [Polyangiales bacterium]
MPTGTGSLLVTGASGHLGRLVIERLLEHGAGPIIATTRNPDSLQALRSQGVEVRKADFDDKESLHDAFRGAERALLISTDALDVPGRRIEQHTRAVKALERAEVSHVVYTSLPNPIGSPVVIAPDHAATEAALAASKLDYTVLRNNLYADLLLASLPGALASGQLTDARAQGAAAYVTREDCARVAAAVLADRSHIGRRTLDVAGERAWTGDQLAALLNELFERHIQHVSVPVEAFTTALTGHGLPRPVADVYASFETAIAKGDLAAPSDTVRRLTGQAPEDLRSFLQRNRAAFGAPR